MHSERFDRLVITIGAVASRRSLLAGLTSGAFAMLPQVLSGGDVAARKRRNKKGKRKKNNKRNEKPSPLPPNDKPSPLPPICIPQCNGRTCDDDGCDGSCGRCGSNEVCDGGTCVCVPACAPANACGANGCGGSCGSCDPSQTCTGTQLTRHECRNGVCTPVITNCAAGQVCFQDACCTKRMPPTCRKQPVSDGCGGTFPVNCGPQQFCCEGPGGGDLICQATPCL